MTKRIPYLCGFWRFANAYKWIPIRKELLLMSNKVIFDLDELFISVGIDVGADFSWMSIALPNQQFVGNLIKSYTIA